jgi:hypothetical protein
MATANAPATSTGKSARREQLVDPVLHMVILSALI